MTTEEKAKAYDVVVNKLKGFMAQDVDPLITRANVQDFFPELKGSEDERIRQRIVDELKDSLHSIQLLYSGDYDHRDEQDKVREDYLKRSIAWLEKQGEQKPINITNEEIKAASITHSEIVRNQSCIDEDFIAGAQWLKRQNCVCNKDDEQKPADKIEPKFHEGDWIINNEHYNIVKVLEVNEQNKQYKLDYCGAIGTMNIELIDIEYHLWAIKDAKEGDILCSSTYHLIWMYKDDGHYYASVNTNYVTKDINGLISIPKDTCPANKEQCDLLLQKIYELGYEFDNKKKKLKKIEQKHVEQSKDEKIINFLKKCVQEPMGTNFLGDIRKVDVLAWLEKQIKQNLVTIFPKFRIGDTVKDSFGGVYHIIEINNNGYKTDDGRFILFKNEDAYTLFTPAWSEEDEKIRTSCVACVGCLYHDGLMTRKEYKHTRDWLNSLKDRI